MDPVAIGEQIKKAYPQYAEFDSAMLGRAQLAKIADSQKKAAGSEAANPYGYLNEDQGVAGQAPGADPNKISALETEVKPTKVNLGPTTQTPKLAGGTTTVTNKPNEGWFFQPVVDWAKGFSAPQSPYADPKKLGIT